VTQGLEPAADQQQAQPLALLCSRFRFQISSSSRRFSSRQLHQDWGGSSSSPLQQLGRNSPSGVMTHFEHMVVVRVQRALPQVLL
jgi:hypothetical protein